MKTILTGPALLTRQLAILRNNTVANRAFRLALQRAHDIALEHCEPGYDVVVRERDHSLSDAQPSLPFLFVEGDARD